MDYKLLDSGHGQKLERFGKIVLIRPCAQAIWKPRLSQMEWDKADARFSREQNNQWEVYRPIPETWTISFHGIKLSLKRTNFGHLGLFPEHGTLWPWMQKLTTPGMRVLNLFAYSGGATLALAMNGAHVTHLDAAKGMVEWARENARRNQLEKGPIRWIVDDVRKYLSRAVRRKEKYEAILLDPPTFGRGKGQEIFKIERDLPKIFSQCAALLSETPRFVVFTSHTPGYTPLVMQQLLREIFGEGKIESGEMALSGPFKLPSGTFARWKP